MKNVKRIISFILVTAMLLGVAIIPSYAADDQPVESEPIVARMYIGHRQHVDSTSGHTWIYIENLTFCLPTACFYSIKCFVKHSMIVL